MTVTSIVKQVKYAVKTQSNTSPRSSRAAWECGQARRAMNMSTNFSYDVFLSHNAADKLRVLRLAERLRDTGLKVWLDDWVIKPGDDIYLAVEHGLETSRVLVLCLSQNALESNWVKLERSTVLFRDPSNIDRRFIPLLLEECQLSDTLRRYKHVDFRHESEKDFAALLEACHNSSGTHDKNRQSIESNEVEPHAYPIVLPEGIGEEIDFLTPIDEPHFYLGMDVQPGHLAAGLVIERPDARKRILKTLEDRRNVLIVGPSGSGKSALMWEVAKAALHVKKWFRIRHLSINQVSILITFIKTNPSFTQAPVGFALDDIGRGLAEGWDALAREVASLSKIILLGSAREEDLLLLTERARAAEVRETANDKLAERLWKELQKRSQTQSLGWLEPWRESRGLLLEYAHILSKGSRLTDVLRTQLTDRVRDSKRETELAILRLASTAGAAGATVDVERLPKILNRSEAEISLALRRLFNEHLIRDISPGRIGALHQLRATELFRLCHEFPPPTSEQTLKATLHCLPIEDIAFFIVRICEINAKWQELLLNEIIIRLNHEPAPVLAANAIKGLGQTHINTSVNAWLNRPEVLILPKTQITIVAMSGLADVEFFNTPKLSHLHAASRSFQLAKENFTNNDPRKQLIKRLTSEATAKLFSHQTNFNELNVLLSSFIGIEISSSLRDQISAIQPNLKTDSLESVAQLLGTVGLIDSAIAEAWVESTGQQTLLDRIYNEVPWVSPPTLRLEEEELAACADVHYVAPSCQTDPHNEVIQLCKLLLAVAPQANVAVSNAINPDGKITGYGNFNLATKRIPRKNLLPSALVDWNNLWITTLVDRIAPPSYTDYLNRASILLCDLVKTLEVALDEFFRKRKISVTKCEKLDLINDQAETLTPPRPSHQSWARNADRGVITTKLQSVLFDCSVNLIKRFYKLPEDANLYIYWTGDIIERIDAAIKLEPWELLIKAPSKELNRLRQIVEGLRFMAGESGVRDVNPIQIWPKPHAQQKIAFQLAAREARNSVDCRIAKTKAEIKQTLNIISPSMNLYVRLKENEIAPWPPVEVLITLPIDDVADWPVAINENKEKLRECVGFSRNLIVIPLINGIAVGHLTVAGVETLFPHESLAHTWLEQENISILNDIRTRTFTKLISYLTEISGIIQFNYGSIGRPMLEQEALITAYSALENSLRHLKDLLISAPEILAHIEDIIEQVRSEKILFAAEMASYLHGEIQPAFVEVWHLRNQLLQLDIADMYCK